MSKTAKTIAEEVLTPARVRDLWTANYLPALPFTPQNFDIGTLLPAMLYMARWGQRRGKGAFKNAYGVSGNGKAVPPTIENVASGLLANFVIWADTALATCWRSEQPLPPAR